MKIVLTTIMGKFTFLLVASVVCWLQPCLINGQGFTSCSYDVNCIGYTNLGVINFNYTPSDNLYQTPNIGTGDVYSWKPCEDFSLGGITAGAIQQSSGSYAYDLGVHRQAFCLADSGYVKFSMMSADMNRISYVRCLCGPGDVLQFESEDPLFTYNLNFTSEYCCPISGSSSSSSISVGSVIVIIFFTVLLAYIIFGTIFQVSVRKAQGRERIPHVSLWSAIPGLVRDGFIFTFTCGRRSGYGKI